MFSFLKASKSSITKKLITRLAILLLATAMAIEAVFAISFREQGVKFALSKANTVAYLVRDGLTSLMVMGVIKDRVSYLQRLEHIKGVESIHIARGPVVDAQFGPGLPIEQPRDNLEKLVLLTGRSVYKVYETPSKVLIRDIIPYKASSNGIVNCLQCHDAKDGQVLGAVDITLNVTDIRYKAFIVIIFTFFIFMGLSGVIFYLMYRFSKPYIKEFNDLINSFSLAQEGRFEEAKIDKQVSDEENNDEAGKVISFFNKMIDILNATLKDIYEKTLTLIGYDILRTGNFIKDTDKIVVELSNIYKFKTTIEKDASLEDIYNRLYMILKYYMSLERFSLYEVTYDKMKLIFAEGLEEGQNLWCKDDILKDNSCCRSFRTGADVDDLEFPNICSCFIKPRDSFNKSDDTLEYYCIPVYLNGQVHNVLQIVYEHYMEEFIKMMIPYIKGYLNEASPVMESKILMQKLKERSVRDQLTGFYNRRYIEEAIEPILNNAKRRETTIGLLMLDVDHFKEINDTYGHDVGDLVLKNVAQAIKESIRESDIPIRFGGEEFMVLLTDIKSDDAMLVAEKIRKNVESKTIPLPNGTVIKRTISIGVVEIPKDTEKFWQAVKFADVALYKAKESGRNRVIRYQKDMWTEEEY